MDDFGDDEDDLNGLTEEDEKGYDEDVEDDQEQLEERREHGMFDETLQGHFLTYM